MDFRKNNYLEVWKILIVALCFISSYYLFAFPDKNQIFSVMTYSWFFLILYWGYFTWQFIKREKGSNINPILRTLALFIPYIPFGMLFYDVFTVTTNWSKKKIVLLAILFVLIYHKTYYLGYILAQYYIKSTTLENILFVILEFVKILPFFIIQHFINKYVFKSQENEDWKEQTKTTNIRVIIIFLFVYMGTFCIAMKTYILGSLPIKLGYYYLIQLGSFLFATIVTYISHLIYEGRAGLNDKTKKIIKTTTIIILVLLSISYIAELADKQINRKTYTKVDNFFKARKIVAKSPEAKNCGNQWLYISKSTRIKLIDEKATIGDEFKNPKIYDSAITSCNYYIKDLNNLSIPNDIPQEKIKAIQEYINDELQLVNGYNQDLKALKACNGNKICIMKMKSDLFDNPSKFLQLSRNMMLSYAKAKKRISVKYILKGGVLGEYFVKYEMQSNIKKLDK